MNGKFEQILPQDFLERSIPEIAREGAHQMLKIALEAEIQNFIDEHLHLKIKDNLQQIVRNGYHQEKNLQTGIGDLKIKVPRSRNRNEVQEDKIEFESQIIPRYLRRNKDIIEFISLLYLKGISTNDFSSVLSQLSGHEVKLSPNTVVHEWEEEFTSLSSSDLGKKYYVYWWIDGIYFNVKAEKDKSCVLIILGATEDGKTEHKMF